MRKSGNIKLRFHHQALPQEYLEHYEASQNQFHTKEVALRPTSSSNRKSDRTATATTAASASPSSTANEFGASERTTPDPKTEKPPWIPKAKHQNGRECSLRLETDGNQLKVNAAAVAPTQKPITKMMPQDLPYMGEITLDNFKPRRGRKPKKADICHLIYKNYGTVFPSENKNADDTEGQKRDETRATHDSKEKSNSSARTSLRLSPESLLEKRLTISADSPDDELLNSGDVGDSSGGGEEPLNLCVRDRYDSDVMTVISDDDAIDTDGKLIDFKPQLTSLSTNNSCGHFTRNFKMALPNFQSALLGNKNELGDAVIDMDGGANGGMNAAAAADINNYGCWQNSGMFLNPMVLYLQKIANANSNSTATAYGSNGAEVPKNDAIKNDEIDMQTTRTRQKKMLVPKKMSQLLKDDVLNSEAEHATSATQSAAANKTTPPPTVTTTTTTTATQGTNQKNPQAPKRKRSAIFIPPVPEESSTNHATEVSICKFKFTGGAKPSLQEKKMLSVDAGGNFRYYSGTGDKSIRGYEFFPRESLKQSSLMAASSAGAFLSTTGQKIANDIPPPSFGLSNELLQIPDLNTSSAGILSSSSSTSSAAHQTPNTSAALMPVHQKSHYHSGRKRKSKRSMQREKLEKTFKEKGFLIQTQQLEQAEGTYCKFRQLRKFTRYLFRSWKDYLPGELQQNQLNSAAMGLNQAGAASIHHVHNGIDTSASQFMSSTSSSHED